MTPHLHRTFIDWCYRCDLGRDEEARAIAEQEEDEARWAACPAHRWSLRVSPFATWVVCLDCGAEEER